MFDKMQKKRMIHLYIIFFVIAIAISTVVFMMYKYKVEGEQNLPFNISKIAVVSSAKTDKVILDGDIYKANVIQNNDVCLVVEKNKKYNKEEIIKKITIDNFQINTYSDVGTIKIYRPSMSEKKYEYTEDYLAQSIEYYGAEKTEYNTDNLQIANQGGIIYFGITLEDLGNISYPENENITADGTLINRLGLTYKNIQFKISFDITMEMDSGNIFKTTMTLKLPEEELLQKGVSSTEKTNLKLIFKRI